MSANIQVSDISMFIDRLILVLLYSYFWMTEVLNFVFKIWYYSTVIFCECPSEDRSFCETMPIKNFVTFLNLKHDKDM